MPGAHTEDKFEAAIEGWLLEHGGYERGVNDLFRADLGLDTSELFTFIGATQNDAWQQLVRLHGGSVTTAQQKFAERVARRLDSDGTLDVLRRGVEDLGVTIRLAYFRPASGLNPALEQRYAANRLTIMRQLHYSASDTAKSVDLALFVNGIPVATAELKNPLTGQSIEQGMTQYRTDRDPKDKTLADRALVHFVVDPDSVMMTTKLAGKDTRFIPFNQGSNGPGNDGGAGNPPPSNDTSYSTTYLWQQVWQRDAWLDLLNRFAHVQLPNPGKKSRRARNGGSTIFPRYHQWNAVLKLEAHARQQGAGQRYLIQHSAGSGKSNTIAWLAHRLASLHDANDVAVFDKVVIISDRQVLDRQLQDTVYQFDHTHGTVVKIDKDSRQLAEALKGAQARVVITTLQKFPFITDLVRDLPSRRYALLIDEAHSSQSGETANEMRAVLSGPAKAPVAELEGEVDAADSQQLLGEALERITKARGPQPNLSMFAFTATPTAKTLELFGVRTHDGDQNPYRAFHLYSMRQAIEERFILDVLASYTTYQTYFRLAKAGIDDPEVESRDAAAQIAALVSLHEAMFAQKAQVIVEHFRTRTARQIGGQAKAMVVCRSRLHAVRMVQHIRAYLDEHGYGNIGTLVAFSGTVKDPDTDQEYTESKLNGFPESETVDRFATPDYRILVVAKKFLTGFDQPLLHTMFVDTKLTKNNAVQTLSRLNRIHPEKSSTFVLDFRNTAEEIREAFEPFYQTTLAAPTDPNLLFDARNALDDFGVLRTEEINGLAAIWFTADPKDRTVHVRLYAFLDPAVQRFKELDEDDQAAFRAVLNRFADLYAFLSQIVPMSDSALEKRYAYCRLLAPRLPKQDVLSMDVDVEMTHLRIARTGEQQIELSGTAEPGKAFSGEGSATAYLPGMEPLSAIIQRFNETFGLDLGEADALHLESIAADLAADPTIQQQAAHNPLNTFKLPAGERLLDTAIERMKAAEDLTIKLLDDSNFRDQVEAWLLPLVYDRAKVAYQAYCPIGELISRGEDQHLEFKSTLRWDLQMQEKSKILEGVALKTIAGFLNSRHGGTLLIGVADDGGPVGLEYDFATLRKEGKGDADLFQIHLTQLLISSVGHAAASNVTTQVHATNGDQVCRVHVNPSGHPVHAKVATANGTKTSFFIRLNNATHAITDQAEVEKYIAQRWSSP